MAIIHEATLTPTKQEILTDWLPSQAWFPGGAIRVIGGFRLDDPAGEVGIELMLVRTAGGTTLHLPCTYRGSEAPELTGALMGTSEHSVLGTRWIYDATADPVYQAAVRRAILVGPAQAAETMHRADGTITTRTSAIQAQRLPGDGTGSGTTVRTVRLPHATTSAAPALATTWDGQDQPLVIAELMP